MPRAAIAETKEPVSAQPREVPLIPSDAIQLNSQTNFLWNDYLVRAPLGITPTDIQNNPHIWKLIQAKPQTALTRLARLTIIAFDESWLIPDAVVLDASPNRITLGNYKIISMPPKEQSWTSEDGMFTVRWSGGQFSGYRVSDNAPLSVHHATLEGCRSLVLQSQYPKRVG